MCIGQDASTVTESIQERTISANTDAARHALPRQIHYDILLS